MKSYYNPIEYIADDGLVIPEVGEWGLEKYRLVGHYCHLFTTTMRNKWDNLVYIDLFSSCGYAKIKGTEKILKSSALIALSLPVQFSHYIFCDENSELLDALKTRVQRDFPEVNATYLCGDCNYKINDILNSIPQYNKNNKVLSFCFVDPFALEIQFKTLKSLGRLQMDFLILVATGMAAKRNEQNYKKPSNLTVSQFTDDDNWREDFHGNIDTSNESFVQYITNKLRANMINLGYLKAQDFHQVKYRINGKGVSLYHLAFFSKHSKGNDFYNIAKNYPNEQKSLF